jgi:hypothetical protein
LLSSGDIDGIDFKTVKADCEKQITVLEAKFGSIFPEKLVFDGENFRTAKLDVAVGLM